MRFCSEKFVYFFYFLIYIHSNKALPTSLFPFRHSCLLAQAPGCLYLRLWSSTWDVLCSCINWCLQTREEYRAAHSQVSSPANGPGLVFGPPGVSGRKAARWAEGTVLVPQGVIKPFEVVVLLDAGVPLCRCVPEGTATAAGAMVPLLCLSPKICIISRM